MKGAHREGRRLARLRLLCGVRFIFILFLYIYIYFLSFIFAFCQDHFAIDKDSLFTISKSHVFLLLHYS